MARLTLQLQAPARIQRCGITAGGTQISDERNDAASGP